MMSAEENWAHFFKPEVRKSGRDAFATQSVVISTASDTQIQAYARGSTSQKITLAATSIDNPSFTAKCSCPAFAKGNFCKHIWATLLAAEVRHPDFFDSKTTIEFAAAPEERAESPMKARQQAYRKEQYQKQKERAKSIRQLKKKSAAVAAEPELPEDVQEAFAFFSQNGFPMENPINEESLKLAKKKLSKIFHPDLGGSHEETVVLNRHFDCLMDFIYA